MSELIDVAMSLLSEFESTQEQPFVLENYMYLTQQDTPEVDADWKKPLLEKLDDEIDPSKTYEDNASVFNIIGKVLNAETETEARKIMSEEQRKQEKELDNYDKLTKQIDNLQNSDKIQLSEIRHVAEQAVNAISDEITKLQKDPEEKNRTFPEIKTDLDFTKATRQQIIEAIGINTLLAYGRKLFNPSNFDNLDTMWQAWDIIDNWDAILELGSDVFILNEGFGIDKNFSDDKYETTKEKSVSVGSEMYSGVEVAPTDADTVREQGSQQEHWQVENRTIDVVNELVHNILVKRALHDCYEKDNDGNVIISKWGIPERVPVRKAVQSILHWVQGATNLEEMIAKLEAQNENNRWTDSLIQQLKNPDEATLQSQFFSIFFRPYQLMSVVNVKQYDGGKTKRYVSQIVNSHPALKDVMDRIRVDFQSAMHPLFTGFGDSVKVNMEYLGTKDSVNNLSDTTQPITLRRALAYLNGVLKKYNNGDKIFTKELAEETIPYLTSACKIIGFFADEELVKSAIMETHTNEDTGEKEYSIDAFKQMRTQLQFIIKHLDEAVEREQSEIQNPTPDYTGYKPFEYNADNNIYNSVKGFIEPVTNKLEDTHNSSVYDSGKMYQSYVTPSFTTMLMNLLKSDKLKSNNKEQEFIANFYGKSEWFATPGERGELVWRNDMLKELCLNPQARKIFAHKVQLNFNKRNFMRTMSPEEYELSLFAEYMSGKNEVNEKGKSVAWFKMPMESNKPSAEFIRYWCYRDKGYEKKIVHHLANMFLQELSRIQTVRMRNKSKGQEGFIENWDVNGRTFCFLPFFNEYLIRPGETTTGSLLLGVDGYDANSDQILAQEIEKRLSGKTISIDEYESNEENENTKFMKMVKDAILTHMNRHSEAILNMWEKDGMLKEAADIENVTNAREDARNYIWNHFLMAKNILQLMVGDTAFYKDAEDLQKRLAELHSPGVRGNKNVIYKGVRVSDGFYRTVLLKDLRKQLNFQTNLIANLTEVLDRKIKNAPTYEVEGWKMLKEALVGENGLYRDINVTDAQGYSSPTSYRKKALIFGKWSDEADAVYEKLIDGTATLSEVRMAFQPLKPFVYGLLEKNLGVDGAPITTMLEPFQAKNSEYLLIMADALLQNEETSQPNLLRAIYTVMEDSYFVGRKRDAKSKIIEKGTYTGKGIDTIQFESAIKCSLQGTIDVAQYWNDIDGEAKAIKLLEDLIYKKDANGNKTDEYDEDTYVQKLDYDFFGIQQEVPEHFRDSNQTHGSQIRMITPSDLDFYHNPEGNLSDPTNIVQYQVRVYDDKQNKFITKRLNAREFRKEYEETIAESINHSRENLIKELHLRGSKKERNLALSKILRREILSSPRYGTDLLLACTVDKDGNFRIPKGDPIQAKRIEQLCNAIIKNRINKQEIAGGPIVQVTNFGTNRLSVVFKDKVTGKALMTEDEWNRKTLYGEALPTDSNDQEYQSYEQYTKDRQGGIAYFECFAPLWSKQIFEKFTRSDGTIDVEAIDALDPELLKMIGYRIPTEDKYSCAPLKIKGFLPAIAGDALMLPYELTRINDSDFDIDKEYVMRKVIFINTKDKKQIVNALWNKYKPGRNDYIDLRDTIEEFVENPEEYKNKDAFYKRLWDEYIKVAYYTYHPKRGPLYRNNKIVDMTYEVLSHETNAMKILNPGGFDNLKKPAYLVEAFKRVIKTGGKEYQLLEHEVDEVKQMVGKNSNNMTPEEFDNAFYKALQKAYYKKVFRTLSNKSIDDLKKICSTQKDLAWVDTEIQFYRQNSAASNLISVQAVNKVAHATLEGDGFFIDVASLCNGEGFTIGSEYDNDGNVIRNGVSFDGYMEIDMTYNENNKLIGKVLGSTVGGAADAVKDPIYNLVNVNMATVNVMNTLFRFGMNEDNVFMFMGQDVIRRAVEEYNKANLISNISFSAVVSSMMSTIKENNADNLPSDSQLFSEELTYDEMIEGLLPVNHPEIDLKVLNIVKKLLTISKTVRNLDFPTRLNSISSASGPLIIDNLIREYKIKKFTNMGADNGKTYVFTKNDKGEFEQADFNTVLSKHPILAAFAEALVVAKDMFSDMPAGSEGFRKLLNGLPDKIQRQLFNSTDKTLLDKLSNFYQTYMLVAAGLLNPDRKTGSGQTELESYIFGFPRYFRQLQRSDVYRKELDLDNNAFIKAIDPAINPESGNMYLKIDFTGFDPQMKQPLIDGWIDLYKKGHKGKDLATRLMIYNIYRGGLGFSPKTFTALISTYLKERFSGKDKNGNEVFYKDVFNPEKFPEIDNDLVYEQFVRNNWNDYRLVSHYSKTDGFGIDYSKNELTIRAKSYSDGSIDNSFVLEMQPELYISTDKYTSTKDADGNTTQVKTTLLWKQVTNSDNLLVYKLVKPMGNNGEYLEMYAGNADNTVVNTTERTPQEEPLTSRTPSPAEAELDDTHSDPISTENA